MGPRWVAIAALIVVATLCCAPGYAEDLAAPPATPAAQSDSRPNSILVFGGIMSTTVISTSIVFNLDETGAHPYYDNAIVGAAYDRDLFALGYGFYLTFEFGIADRFGDYKQCCAPVVMSEAVLNSGEFWAGPQLRFVGPVLFDLFRVGTGVTIGFSAVTNSIGAELQRQILASGNARFQYYLGPEIDFSAPSAPNFELVVKLQHRSGGKELAFLPTLGNMKDAYNGNVVGIRYRF